MGRAATLATAAITAITATMATMATMAKATEIAATTARGKVASDAVGPRARPFISVCAERARRLGPADHPGNRRRDLLVRRARLGRAHDHGCTDAAASASGERRDR